MMRVHNPVRIYNGMAAQPVVSSLQSTRPLKSCMGSMATLTIHLLGEFRLEFDGAPVAALNTQRLQTLLAYLVLFRYSAISRQQLAFLLWPDSSEAQARTNLRNLLHTLTRALPDAETFLSVNATTLQWRGDSSYALDVQEFEQAAHAANSALSLEQAVALYRGELLPGVYDDWVLAERERLDREFTCALEKLIDQLQAEQSYRQAITHAQRLARHDPLREDTYRRLMELHALSGDRSGVVRVYNQCAAILKRELDVEPSRETQQAYQRALKLEPPASTAVPQPSAPLQPILPAPLSPELPLPPPPELPAPRPWYLKPAFLREAAYGGSIALSVMLLAILVLALEMHVLLALLISVLGFTGMFFMFNWGTHREIARLDLRDEIRGKLHECRVHIWEIRKLATKILKLDVRQRVEQICILTDTVCAKLEQDEIANLVTVTRFEYVLAETRNILELYMRILRSGGGGGTPPANADLIRDIEDKLLPLLENSLQDFAVTLNQGDALKLEAAIRVLENTLKTEGIA